MVCHSRRSARAEETSGKEEGARQKRRMPVATSWGSKSSGGSPHSVRGTPCLLASRTAVATMSSNVRKGSSERSSALSPMWAKSQ